MSAKKSALGRGLGALIDSASDPVTTPNESVEAVNEVSINQIEVNPFQPRKTFDETALQELATSIRELGIIQPITVRKLEGGKYQLISGERRFRASQLAGLDSIPAYVRTADDQSMLELALVENIQREDLDAIEIAISYQRLMDECHLTQETLSDRVGKKRATVANYLRLLRLPAEIQLAIRDHKISMGHARALINIENPENQKNIFNHILEEELSVRQVEELVRSMAIPDEEIPLLPKKVINDDASGDFIDYRNQLRKYFKTKVELKRNNKGVGKIVIPFNSDNELLQILTMVESLHKEE